MSKKGAKTQAAAAADMKSLLPLAAGTVLLLLGLFAAWQTWLIADENHAINAVYEAQDHAVQAMTGEIASERDEVVRAMQTVDPALFNPADPASAVVALRRKLPEAKMLQIYSGGLEEVLHANYRVFGYAKAAQLMAAQSADGNTLMQSVNGLGGDGERHLSLALPVGDSLRPQAWLWVELPFSPVEDRFEAQSPAGGRLELRQGDDRGDLRLLAVGSDSAESELVGKPIAGSNLTVVAALPRAYIVLPRTWWLSALAALAGIGAGVYLLWLRGRGTTGKDVVPNDEPVFADMVEPAPVASRQTITRPVVIAKPPGSAGSSSAESADDAVNVDRSIFRAYDVRGVVDKTLTKDVAKALGQSIGTLMREKGLNEIVVGRDGRLSGPELAGALAEGLRMAGIDVIDLGAAPTPVVYFAAFHYQTGCGVAVTGSHNPPEYNGFKIVVGGETLSGDALQDLYQRIAGNKLERSPARGRVRHVDVLPDYIERITSDVQTERRLKVVVDAGNGIAGAVAPQVLEGIGCEVIPLYCDVDGNFPNHHPDPSDPHNLEDLMMAVKQTGADLGLAFDGDGDRLGVVTRQGEIIFPDRILMLFARDVLSRQPGATVIYDVKCTGHLKGQILDAGGSPLMWRTGHSLIKAKMRDTGAELAGEMSGHFFFQERWYGFDDGIYAAARLMEILAGDLEERTPEDIFATCPKGVSTPELKVPMAEGQHYSFMEAFRERASFGDATLTTIDGVRADWSDGWGLVRASNTTPVLVLRFDADNESALARIQGVFRQQLLAVGPRLRLPF